MKILLYPEIHENFGTGNVLRMYYLYNHLLVSCPEHEIFFTCNNMKMAEKLISSLGGQVQFSKLDKSKMYDVILYDSIKPNHHVLRNCKYITKKLIAFDYFEYSSNIVDIIINLFDQSNQEKYIFKGKIYEGIKYFILKDEIVLSSKPKKAFHHTKPNVLITFGGEDPSSNTLKTLESINFNQVNVRVILGLMNKDREKILELYSKQAEILDPTPKIGEFMSRSDIIICGGGTTLLEAIYIGNPVIAIPQHTLEEKFINFIKERINLFELSEFDSLVNSCLDINFRANIFNSYSDFVDGKGTERITDIILSRSV
jgi:spore coat polysaccharide biosynthesis predicted glycosyltransferase SpsG